MKELQCADFTPLVNSTFKVTVQEQDANLGIDGIETELELTSAEEKNNDSCDQFSLMFKGGTDTPLAQGAYYMEHEALGKQFIFVVPVGEIADGEGDSKTVSGYQYQAVFSRLK